jgi:cobyrinic acid a,c-diamide synthase
VAARLVIAGTHSGVGKTTVTVGLIAALRRRGLSVQPFKVGPDYIDPTYHTLAAGRPCRNLDTWMVPPQRVAALFARAAADVNLIEGVMGVYDGLGYDDETGSTAEVAKLLRAPVVLVLDASRLARSAGAVAAGFRHFDPALPLAGFIINRAAGESHGRGVSSVVERATGLPVFGWLPREAGLHVPERHLGLVPTAEPGRWAEFVAAAGEVVSRHLDLDRVLSVAAGVGQAFQPDRLPKPVRLESLTYKRPLLAVARDEAFSFTYADNLDLLQAAGAALVFFSPLRDPQLPAGTAGVILSGGFPEVYADRLAANRTLHAALRTAHRQGIPLYAECGGLMYLTEAIVDGEGRTQPMVGLLPGTSLLGERLTLGYRLARAAGDSWLLPAGAEVRGHEFHYSRWQGRPADLPPAYLLLPRDGSGEATPEGARVGSLWASYVHLHFAARPDLAARFVAACTTGGRA